MFPDRWADGTTRPGFAGPALVHGAYSEQRRAKRAISRTERLQTLITAIADVTPVERVWARLFVEADDNVAGYTAFLDATTDGSPMTTKGRQRAAMAGRRQEVAQLLELGEKLQSALARKKQGASFLDSLADAVEASQP